MDRGLSGRNPLAYMGVEPSTPPNLVINKQDPTVNDGFNYALGTYWLTVPQMQTKTATGLFVLISLANNSANWEQIWPVGANDLTFITDDGQTSPSNQGDLNLNGTGTMVLVHSAANNTIELLPNYPNPAGDPGNDGMVFIGGQSGGQWAQLTQGAGITIANGDGVISISSGGGGGGITEVHTDTADVPPAGDGSISIVGDGTLITVDGDTLSSTATITQVTNPTISGTVTFSGDIDLAGTLTAAGLGGAGALVSDNAGVVTSSQGTAGQVLTAVGGTNVPIWASAPGGAGQDAFFYAQNTTRNAAVTSAGPTYILGSIVAMTKIFDQNGTQFAGTTFTASKTGIYYFNVGVSLKVSTGSPILKNISITVTDGVDPTNSRVFTGEGMKIYNGFSNSYDTQKTFSVIAKMSTTATVQFSITGESGQTPPAGYSYNLLGTDSGTTCTFIQGYFVQA